MPVKIVVPAAGQTTDELRLLRWLVKVGDPVKKGQILAELETDKATMELESIAEGTVLKLEGEVDQMVTVGEPLLYIARPGEALDVPIPDAAAAKPSVAAVSSAAAPAPPAVSAPEVKAPAPVEKTNGHATAQPGRVRATPAARTLARRSSVDLEKTTGSGPEGCVVRRDVEAAQALVVAASVAAPVASALVDRVEPFTPMRRAIATRLQQSVREAPHFAVSMEIDMSRALARRAQLNADPAAGARVSINDLLIEAVAATLRAFPRLNSRLEGESLHYLAEINIGIAVGVEEGLLVPVLPQADALPVERIARESARLIGDARAGKLNGKVRGTFTISNLGMYGVRQFTAIINPPETAILAVAGIQETLKLTTQGIVNVPMMTVTLSADHRIVDGVLGAQFLAALRDRLQ